MNDFNNMSRTDPANQQRRPAPPLFRELLGAFKNGRNGTVTVSLDGGTVASISIDSGRVIQVTHPDTDTSKVLEILSRIGLVGEKQIEKATKLARKHAITLEDALVKAGAVSATTLGNIRELLAREALLDLLMERELDVSAVWASQRGTRACCVLPIPYLLKSANKRMEEHDDIRRVVPSGDIVFEKALSKDLDGAKWEDLKLGPAQRQVFFFLDGQMSVADLGIATGQGQFAVERSLKSLFEDGLVRKVVLGDERTGKNATRFSAFVRALSFLIAILIVMVGMATVAGRTISDPLGRELGARDPYREVIDDAAMRRVLGALRLHQLIFNRLPDDFEDMAAPKMVLRSDRRAAAMITVDESFLFGAKAVQVGEEDKD